MAVIAAVLLDALGTLLELEPPAPRLAAATGAPPADCERAFRAEIAYYRAHILEASDPERLADLRARCAQVLSDALGREVSVGVLLECLTFNPYPEVPGALAALRARGLRLVVASNWDVSLHDVLRRAGLLELLDGVVTSAECGAAKPDPAVLRAALRVAGADPAAAVHVGDSAREDVEGARAAGVAPVLLLRGGELGGWPAGQPPQDRHEPSATVPVIRSLSELPGLLASGH